MTPSDDTGATGVRLIARFDHCSPTFPRPPAYGIVKQGAVFRFLRFQRENRRVGLLARELEFSGLFLEVNMDRGGFLKWW